MGEKKKKPNTKSKPAPKNAAMIAKIKQMQELKKQEEERIRLEEERIRKEEEEYCINMVYKNIIKLPYNLTKVV